MNLRVLITGSGGFIGSRLAIRCREAGHEVIATAHRSTPELAQALGVPDVIPMDVLNPHVADLPLDADILFHCATANDIVSRDFKSGVNLSVHGTRNVLELALRRGIRRVVFFSTIQVYGTELHGEITENTPVRCESSYALNHLLGEEICRFYAAKHGLDIVLLRPANVIGVPDASTVQRSTLVPMCFVKEALATGKIVMRSSGRQIRNFVTSDQVANICLCLGQSFPSAATVINASSPWNASIAEMAGIVAEVFFERTGIELVLEIQSDEPEQGNKFRIYSSLDPCRDSAEACANAARGMIRRLFDYFQASM
ncbi:MAG: NAD(P)-dependent oxidoreductase [Prosthecobacter sp.]|uniref:NAD-dependent epimerase/dehydratase family protein n=1 Tax=Prosthecobacter sp. TaxID=1965333 RepID=UPI0025F381ED|nr:NAD(P)-dependent oxidoreductase [Prosthecobacter sp.]MCF7787334.1 NAD(P)-dependent oxidoreductase [Prosthecobacter sp.]